MNWHKRYKAMKSGLGLTNSEGKQNNQKTNI